MAWPLGCNWNGEIDNRSRNCRRKSLKGGMAPLKHIWRLTAIKPEGGLSAVSFGPGSKASASAMPNWMRNWLNTRWFRVVEVLSGGLSNGLAVGKTSSAWPIGSSCWEVILHKQLDVQMRRCAFPKKCEVLCKTNKKWQVYLTGIILIDAWSIVNISELVNLKLKHNISASGSISIDYFSIALVFCLKLIS